MGRCSPKNGQTRSHIRLQCGLHGCSDLNHSDARSTHLGKDGDRIGPTSIHGQQRCKPATHLRGANKMRLTGEICPERNGTAAGAVRFCANASRCNRGWTTDPPMPNRNARASAKVGAQTSVLSSTSHETCQSPLRCRAPKSCEWIKTGQQRSGQLVLFVSTMLQTVSLLFSSHCSTSMSLLRILFWPKRAHRSVIMGLGESHSRYRCSSLRRSEGDRTLNFPGSRPLFTVF